MEQETRDLESSQVALTQEMDKIRASCQQLTTALDSIQVQVNYAVESNKRVSCVGYCEAEHGYAFHIMQGPRLNEA